MITQTHKYQECPETGLHTAKALLEKLGKFSTLDSERKIIHGALSSWFSSIPVTIVIAPEEDHCVVTVTSTDQRAPEKAQKLIEEYVSNLSQHLLTVDPQKPFITKLRSACIQHLKYSEKLFESGIPLDVFATDIVKLMAHMRFFKVSSVNRIEFWEVTNSGAGEYAHISAIFIEKGV